VGAVVATTAALLAFTAPFWAVALPIALLVVFLATRRQPVTADPHWLPEDRAVVFVWQAEQGGKCPDCGTFDWEWEEDGSAWTAGIHWCLGCKQLEELRDQSREAQHPEGYKLRLYRGKDDDGL
jgi:hypothetical protein